MNVIRNRYVKLTRSEMYIPLESMKKGCRHMKNSVIVCSILLVPKHVSKKNCYYKT